jgi:ABC-2 type transport system permease protein
VTYGFLAGVRLQLWNIWSRMPDSLFPLVTTPFFAIIFLAIVDDADRPDLAGYAVLAPVLIALWWISLFEAGGIISGERWLDTLEASVAAPAPYAASVLGRILVVTLTGLASFVEVLIIARVFFGVTVEVHHPGPFALTLVATAFAMAGTSVVMASVFALTRSSVTWGNSLSYPFYVLGGVLVPVSFLPDWIEPLSRVVFLSWSSDLLRATLDPAAIHDFSFKLSMVVLLGCAGYAVGGVLFDHVLRKGRAEGTLQQA